MLYKDTAKHTNLTKVTLLGPASGAGRAGQAGPAGRTGGPGGLGRASAKAKTHAIKNQHDAAGPN